MKKLLMIHLIIFSLPQFSNSGTVTFSSTPAPSVAFDKGFNFRATSGYVTDGTNETYVIHTENYPTTRNGVTFGWGTTGATPDSRDRDSGIDRRIAGINFIGNSNNTWTFRVDLPSAGNYNIQLGYGDAGGNAQKNYIVIKDSDTALITVHANTASTPTFGDATGATYNAATWPGSEVAVSTTFATNQLNMTIGGTIDTDNTVISHLFISKQ